MGFFYLGSDVAYYVALGDLDVLVNLVLVDEKHASVPLTSLISWNIHPILGYIDIVRLGFQAPLSGACTLGIFQYLRKLPLSFVFDGL